MNTHTFPDDTWLRDEAGEGAFKRGVAYSKQGAIRLLHVSEQALSGEADGSETYRLWFKLENGSWRWSCDCPAASGRALCKHLVAAVMTARGGGGEAAQIEAAQTEAVPPKRSRKTAAETTETLAVFLRAQSAERLADWLLAFARDNRDIEKQLLLYRAANAPGAMQEALSKVLATNGFMDYRRTLDYAHRVRAAIAQLHAVLQRDPVEGRGLCEYALKRLFKLIERVDDSSGAVGDCMAEIAHLHAQACTAAPPGKALAKTLWLMQEQEQWGLLPIAGYWEALGAAGQAAYAKLVVDAFEQLPPVKTERWDSDGFHACRLAEDLARCTGDFELLQRVLRRDLSSPHHHLCVLKSLQEFGRTREALVFAEAAVKRFPKDATLRNALAQCLAEAGLDEDALEQRWAAFLHQPDGSTWDAIKQSAGAHWPQWRAKALAQVTEATDAPASVRLQLLAHDGALDEAIALARSKPADMFSLQQLASRVRSVDPQAASEFYLRVAKVSAERLDGPSRYEAVVALLLQAQRCAPSQALEAFTAAIRQQHARKTKLLAMLDQAGL